MRPMGFCVLQGPGFTRMVKLGVAVLCGGTVGRVLLTLLVTHVMKSSDY